MDQNKMERLLRLMKYMSGSVDYSVGELARKMGTSDRTVYRYIDTFKSAGFAVIKLYGDTYKLGKLPKNSVDMDKLVYFSEEEAYLVNSMINQLPSTNSLKTNLKTKLAAVYKATNIAEYTMDRKTSALVEELGEAVKNRNKVVLKGYQSAHSLTTRDRLVEPFAFTPNYTDVYAFDLEDGKNKIFKISRIDSVLTLNETWTAEDLHRKQEIDLFRISGNEPKHIKLRMTMRAKNLLLEEFPLAEKYLQYSGTDYILDTEVYGFEGVGRFVAGLVNDIEIVESPELRVYVKAHLSAGLDKL